MYMFLLNAFTLVSAIFVLLFFMNNSIILVIMSMITTLLSIVCIILILVNFKNSLNEIRSIMESICK